MTSEAEVAREAMIRLGVSDPVIEHVRTGTNAVFRSGQVAVRVAHRGYDLLSLHEQNDVADFLAHSDFPTPRRLSPVMEIADRLVTTWEWVEGSARPSDHAFGALLRRFHEVTREYPGRAPDWTPQMRAQARLDDGLVGVSHRDREMLDERLAFFLAEIDAGAADQSMRIVHGDAHMGNVIADPQQHWLIDFERFCRGPIEWDLTQRAAQRRFFDGGRQGWEEFIAGYGGVSLSARFDRLTELRAFIMTTWLLTLEPIPEVSAEREVRLEYWRAWGREGARPSEFAPWSPL